VSTGEKNPGKEGTGSGCKKGRFQDRVLTGNRKGGGGEVILLGKGKLTE
jgi:hypothetical protein